MESVDILSSRDECRALRSTPFQEREGQAMKSSSITQYIKLSVPERIQLVEDRWDNIAEMPEELPLTKAQQAELDLRLNRYHRNPEEGSLWGYVKENIR